MNECIEIIYEKKGVTATKSQVDFAAESAKSGKLDLTVTDDATIDYRESMPTDVLLATLDTCRAKHVGTEGTGVEGTSKTIDIKFNARVSTKVTRGSRVNPQDGVHISSPNPAVGKCTTHDGYCDLPVEKLKSMDTVIIEANFHGVTPKTVTVSPALSRSNATPSPLRWTGVVTIKARRNDIIRRDATDEAHAVVEVSVFAIIASLHGSFTPSSVRIHFVRAIELVTSAKNTS